MTHSKGSQCIDIFHAYNLRTKAPVTQPNRRNAADMLHLVIYQNSGRKFRQTKAGHVV